MTESLGVADAVWERVLELAWSAYVDGTTPVGAVVVDATGGVLSEGRNSRYAGSGALAGSHLAHAEIDALRHLSAGRSWTDHVLVTSLEPCAMCHGATLQATLQTLVYAAADPWAGTASLRMSTPQAQRRQLLVRGPLPGVRGDFAALLLLRWLADRPSAAHVTDCVRTGLPAVAALADRADAAELLAAGVREHLTAQQVVMALEQLPPRARQR